jgi:hypothetical protein
MTDQRQFRVGSLEAEFEAQLRSRGHASTAHLHDLKLLKPQLQSSTSSHGDGAETTSTEWITLEGRWEDVPLRRVDGDPERSTLDRLDLTDVSFAELQRDGKRLRGVIRARARCRIAASEVSTPLPTTLDKDAQQRGDELAMAISADGSTARRSLVNVTSDGESGGLALLSMRAEGMRTDGDTTFAFGQNSDRNRSSSEEASRSASQTPSGTLESSNHEGESGWKSWFSNRLIEAFSLLFLLAIFAIVFAGVRWLFDVLGVDGIPADILPSPLDDWSRWIRSKAHPVTQLLVLGLGVLAIGALWNRIRRRGN